MNRWIEILLIPRNAFKFKKMKNIEKYQKNWKYQIIDFYWKNNVKNLSLMFSITLNPFSMKELTETKLNKKKKILINGYWKDLKYEYHFLKSKGFDVYLLK
ncbi:hypothetical protein [Mycoplasmoides pirum]|uniref:hypothetical protein n=1 Tax=Mycoplasmoides pirum TaxID=2122 RepID=UPI0004898D72|nr:hypothetical protein [Mycoplasmoides pirum]